MATNTTARPERDPSLRPRIVDVTDMDYSTAISHVDPDASAYFQRKPGQTTLVIR